MSQRDFKPLTWSVCFSLSINTFNVKSPWALSNVANSIFTDQRLPWSKTVPSMIYLHAVLTGARLKLFIFLPHWLYSELHLLWVLTSGMALKRLLKSNYLRCCVCLCVCGCTCPFLRVVWGNSERVQHMPKRNIWMSTQWFYFKRSEKEIDIL